jgi:hypothetical protein
VSERSERIEGLRRRGEHERELVAEQIAALRFELEERKSRWKKLGILAGGAAAAGTVAYQIFGRNSLSAKVGRLTTAASVLFALGRAFGRAKRFF